MGVWRALIATMVANRHVKGRTPRNLSSMLWWSVCAAIALKRLSFDNFSGGFAIAFGLLPLGGEKLKLSSQLERLTVWQA